MSTISMQNTGRVKEIHKAAFILDQLGGSESTPTGSNEIHRMTPHAAIISRVAPSYCHHLDFFV